MTTPNPLLAAFPNPPSPISAQIINIAGIQTTIYGLSELAPNTSRVACLWLLHPRLQTQSCMQPVASSIIYSWNTYLQSRAGALGEATAKATLPGLIAASLDHRNHGSRSVDELANQAWNGGNLRHAQDMFSIYQGTALDVSLLIDHLPSYILTEPISERQHSIITNLVLGISLGGHAAWHCLFHEPRISAGIVVIGCPDFERLMFDRAARSKLDTWTGEVLDFKGSRYYPSALVEVVHKHDPASILLSWLNCLHGNYKDYQPSPREKEKLDLLLHKHLAGKRILNLAGGADKLVPHQFTVPLLSFLEGAIVPNGWSSIRDVVLEDIVFEGVGHALSPGMMSEAIRFTHQVLADEPPSAEFKQVAKKESKI